MSNKSGVSEQVISLPKGGGAIRGIGEKFSINPVTGTSSISVPIYTSPGRSGFQPQLSLSYDSGAGNGPFGLGWNLSLPAITRKTDKGLPRYRDDEESDTFVLSSAEDLVPVLVEAGGGWRHDEADERKEDGAVYRVERYRPRIEGPFARVERWTNTRSGEMHWRSISKDNVTTLYGKTAESRIADPADPLRVFSWLICESYDDKGNAILYEYESEDSSGIDSSQPHESNRTDGSRSANRYIKRIKYGNRPSRLIEPDLSRMTWLFEVVFDYDEGHYEALPIDAKGRQFVRAAKDKVRDWSVRQDPFSTYRAGFEVRTYRLCCRVLMFHHFPNELGTEDYLVRSTEFAYEEGPVASFITNVTQSGYVRRADGTYLKKSLPPLEFGYSQRTIREEVQEIDAENLENLPYGVDGSRYQWLDLDGEGVTGILTEQAGAWFYKRNLSPVSIERQNGRESATVRFAPTELVADKPSLAEVNGGRQQFLDLAGDGSLDLVELDNPLPGFYERTDGARWDTFTPFVSMPKLAWSDPNLRFVDLTGDGHADVLITEDEVFAWYPSLGEDGFGPRETARQFPDEEEAPRLIFADGTQSFYLADISGDGLADLVRVRSGEVCYWPNLGYGRFGAKVTMVNAPHFDHPDQFDQRRVRLADIDGSGPTDMIYLGRDGIQLYFNRSGNGWSDQHMLTRFPRTDDLSSVSVVDLLGNGTTCIVWSSSLPGDAHRPMRYIDLMGSQKPHLLVSVKNNLGTETRMRYAPSTRFYLADREAGQPWVTKLPFPVHVVERVETYDRIGRNRFVTRYAYHHGHFDGAEREFRGFGMVEQWDTEEVGSVPMDDTTSETTNLDEASYVPPVWTKTWFHTGAYLQRERISLQFAHEYYGAPQKDNPNYEAAFKAFEASLLPGTLLPGTSLLPDGRRVPWTPSAEEEREACRALRGSILRQEVFALDGTDKCDRPYTVSERNYAIEVLQPQADNRHAVFFVHPRETIDYHYERDPSNPRISHAFTLEVDAFGNVLKSATVGYGRRQPDPRLSAQDRAKQTQTLVTCTENGFTNSVELDDAYHAPLPCESRTYELTDLVPGASGRFDFATVDDAVTTATSIAYEATPSSGLQKRLIEHVRTLYRKDNLTGPLPLGQLQSLALPFESYKLALTPELITQVYGDRVTEAMLSDEGKYVHSEEDTNWWIPSGQVFYSPNVSDASVQELTFAQQHFFLPHRFRDPFGHNSTVTYDKYDLLLQETRDPLGNVVTVVTKDDQGNDLIALDYRVMQPWLMTDPNANRTEVAFDALGLVVGTATMGKLGENGGDSLAGFEADLIQQEVDDFFVDPEGQAANILGTATTRIVYDLHRYKDAAASSNPQPTFAATLARETHASDPVPAGGVKIQVGFSYSDGFGREIQKKIQAEPGEVEVEDDAGNITTVDTTPNIRWVGSGWAIFNNKGKPVRQYEPFFDETHRFKFGKKVGVSPILFYDPVERVVATLHPNHTWEKVVFDPWGQKSWDVNDTVLFDAKNDPDVGGFFRRLQDAEYLPTWHARRQGGAMGPQEQAAAGRAAVHSDTPAVAHLDPLGRAFLTVAHNRFKPSGAPPDAPPTEEFYRTRVVFDIEGNQREIVDARDRVVVRYDYDMLGSRIHQASMEAGARWTLNDVAAKPIRAWDSRGHQFKTDYDPLRRPVRHFVRGTDAHHSDPRTLNRDVLFEQTEYGEGQAGGTALNLRTRVFKQYDGTGVVTNEAYDFKGNLLRSSRELAQDYKNIVDWSAAVQTDGMYSSSTTYDALNRPVTLTTPDNSVVRPTYNEANLLERVEANLRGEQTNGQPVWTPFVTNIDYDPKGQRTLIRYGNGADTRYRYDPDTFRLIHLYTRRGAEFTEDCGVDPPPRFPAPAEPPQNQPCGLQNLHYTYDPVGNIAHIRDDAQQTIYFRNRRVEPSNDYTYDAVYRLIEAIGREHLGQNGAGALLPPSPTSYNDRPRVGLSHPGDGNAIGRYIQQYVYDEVGNFLEMIHRGADPAHPGWRRAYAYNEASLLEQLNKSNRLTRTTFNPNGNQPQNEDYAHDAHGNTTRMPHLTLMEWDFKDRLRMAQRQAVNAEDEEGLQRQGERTYYVYDAVGQRVRKVTELATGQIKDERVYLGGFEIYRRQGVNAVVRETLHVMGDKQGIALIETRTQGDDGSPRQLIRYQCSNHLGSANLELDQTGRVISYEEYYPYGSTSYQAVDKAIKPAAKRYCYTGKERDEESGLYYYGARYYAPWLGRWTSCDPAALVDGTDRYVAVRNSPIMLVDPNGKEVQPPSGPFGAPQPGGGGFSRWDALKKMAETLKEMDAARKIAEAAKAAKGVADVTTKAEAAGNLGGTVGAVGTGAVGAAAFLAVVAGLLVTSLHSGEHVARRLEQLKEDLEKRRNGRQTPMILPPAESAGNPKIDPDTGQPPKSLPGSAPETQSPVEEQRTTGNTPVTEPDTSLGRNFVFAPKVIYGGAKGKVRVRGGEGHHTPSWKSIKESGKLPELGYDKAPALGMKKRHHRETPTHGSRGGEAFMNRTLQEILIQEGQFDVAQDLDLAWVRERYGSLYDKGIMEVLKHSVELGLRPDYGEFSFLFDTNMSKLSSQRLELKHFK